MSPKLEHLGDPLRPRAAQQRADARDQLGHRERLDDIVVGAGREPAHALALLAARRQHDDGQPPGLGPRAQPAAELDAGQARQHPVEQDQVGRLLGSLIGLVAARRALDRVAFRFEIVAQQHGQRLFVLDDQDPRAFILSSSLDHRQSLQPGWKLVVSPFGRSSASARPSTM